jgi:hypothetical protein
MPHDRLDTFSIFNEFMKTEWLIDKDVSKTDETLHDECIFKSRK